MKTPAFVVRRTDGTICTILQASKADRTNFKRVYSEARYWAAYHAEAETNENEELPKYTVEITAMEL